MPSATIVASDAGGIRDVVEDGRSGHLLPLDRLDQLPARALETAADPAETDRLGAAARTRAEEFGGDRERDALLALYAELVG